MKRENKQFAKILDRAIELLSRRKGWIREAEAENKQRFPVSATSPQACSFCVGGAMIRAEYDIAKRLNGGFYASLAIRKFAESAGFADIGTMITFNAEQKTKAPVLKKLRAVRASLA